MTFLVYSQSPPVRNQSTVQSQLQFVLQSQTGQSPLRRYAVPLPRTMHRDDANN
jgi:hypothetical protein